MLLPFNIIAGYAVCESISDYAEAKLKWPNDCIIKGKKVCGMLLEASFSGNSASNIVFGAGINISNTYFPDDIAYKAACISDFTNYEVKNEVLLANILLNIENMIKNYTDNKLKIEDIWKDYSACYNNKISIHINGEKKEMIEKGILSTGQLIVENIESGSIEYINAGEIGYDFNS